MDGEDSARLLVSALGLRGADLTRVAARLQAIGGLRGLRNAGAEAMDGLVSAAGRRRLEAVLVLVEATLSTGRRPDEIDDADAVAAYFADVTGRPTEAFWVLMLDARGRAIGHQQIAAGTLTACLVHPREVFAPAIRARAAQIVVVHNHPSGDPTPSEEDVRLTDRLAAAGQLLGIPVVDHVILSPRGHRSIGIPSGASSDRTAEAEARRGPTLYRLGPP